jgi:hypothetical protein
MSAIEKPWASNDRWLDELIADPTANTESIAGREGCSIMLMPAAAASYGCHAVNGMRLSPPG